MRSSIIALASLLAFTGAAHAQAKFATKDEAQAIVKKAAGHMKSAGNDKAFADFSQKGGTFTDRDLYVYVLDMNGKVAAHGSNEKLIGRDLIALKDVDGKPFVGEQIARAKSGQSGWTDYKWPHPMTKEIEAKTTYCEPSGNFVICAGVYK